MQISPNNLFLYRLHVHSQDPTFEKALQGMEQLQQQLQSGGGGGGGGGGDRENSEDNRHVIGIRVLDLENPLEVITHIYTVLLNRIISTIRWTVMKIWSSLTKTTIWYFNH